MLGLTEFIQDSIQKYPQIKVVSFDIFDTLLFRMVAQPSDIFIKAAELGLQKGLLKDYITPEMYRNLRIEAEKKARMISQNEHGHREVTLDEIFQCFPFISNDIKSFQRLEVDCEIQFCYVNPDAKELFSLLQDLHSKNIFCILTSDMYLTAKQEQEILEGNGISLEWFDHLFVSCEIGKSKQEGELYSFLTEWYQISPCELLHIGDNYMDDVVSAQQFGVKACYYDVISGNHNLPLQMEEMQYASPASTLLSLRKYTDSKANHFPEHARSFYRTGAVVMGPIMAAFAEWILDMAEKEECYHLFPLMREGMFFSKLLLQAAEKRKKKFHIQPLYISRKAVFLPSIKEYKKEVLDQSLLEAQGTVKEWLQLFEIDTSQITVVDSIIFQQSMSEFRKQYTKRESPEAQLYQYLLSDFIIQTVNASIGYKHKQMMEYLQQCHIPQTYITVDIGYRGTIQQGLTKVLEKAGWKNRGIHLLAFGTEACTEKTLSGVDLRGFFSMHGSDKENTDRILSHAFLLEQMLMPPCGSTSCYQNQKPVLESDTGIHDTQRRNTAYCQEGMLAFQKEFLYLKYSQKKTWLSFSPKELLSILIRLFIYPTNEEAISLGSFYYNDNFSGGGAKVLCPEQYINVIRQEGVQNFFRQKNIHDIKWSEGLIARAEPSYFLDAILKGNITGQQKQAFHIVDAVRKQEVHSVVIVGAGTAGRKLCKLLSYYGVSIEAFTDNNPGLIGKTIDDIPVKKLSEHFQTDNYVIGSFAFAEELEHQIREQKGSQVYIFSVQDT